jgi:hypothetical protein
MNPPSPQASDLPPHISKLGRLNLRTQRRRAQKRRQTSAACWCLSCSPALMPFAASSAMLKRRSACRMVEAMPQDKSLPSSRSLQLIQLLTLSREVGQRSSIARMISSAQRMPSDIALTVAGTLFAPSYCASFRAARMLAAISSTRLRPSSIVTWYTFAFHSSSDELPF